MKASMHGWCMISKSCSLMNYILSAQEVVEPVNGTEVVDCAHSNLATSLTIACPIYRLSTSFPYSASRSMTPTLSATF